MSKCPGGPEDGVGEQEGRPCPISLPAAAGAKGDKPAAWWGCPGPGTGLLLLLRLLPLLVLLLFEPGLAGGARDGEPAMGGRAAEALDQPATGRASEGLM